MKRQNFVQFAIALMLIFSMQIRAYSQVVISDAHNVAGDNSAVLDIISVNNDKGLLIPRVNLPTLANPSPVNNPSTGLMVYNTNNLTGPGFFYWAGNQWKPLGGGSGTETDPTVPLHVKDISITNVSNWNTAYSWGNHSIAGYLTSFSETDPTIAAHIKGISSTNISNWNSAYTHSTTNTGSVHGSTTVGSNFLRLTNPSAESFIRINADNSISTLNASDFRAAIGIGAGSVSSIATGNGITGGTITTTGTLGLTGQALALHNLSSNGIIARTGSGTVAARTITAGSGISITNGDGVSGNPTIAAKTYAIGDFAHGGIVFWVDETGQHGLVCAKADINGGAGMRWFAGTYTNTMARGFAYKGGFRNTALIVANQGYGDGDTYAALFCSLIGINPGDFGDWYLPSIYELRLMYINRAAINATATANFGSSFSDSSFYWSSTEYDTNRALAFYFLDNTFSYYSKHFQLKVRAVRAF